MLFVLPTIYPITALNFNYTIVAVAVVLGGASLWWVLSAKHWFTGPRPNIDGADGAGPASSRSTDAGAAETVRVASR